jgi:hypothetical protein
MVNCIKCEKEISEYEYFVFNGHCVMCSKEQRKLQDMMMPFTYYKYNLKYCCLSNCCCFLFISLLGFFITFMYGRYAFILVPLLIIGSTLTITAVIYYYFRRKRRRSQPHLLDV